MPAPCPRAAAENEAAWLAGTAEAGQGDSLPARTERRAVVTSNLRDYRPLHADATTPGGPGHFGMIFMPGTYRHTKQDTGRIIAALEAKLTEYPGDEDLANGECWL